MPDDGGGQKLRPATREEVMESLAYAIRYQGRRRVADADSFMARIAAERLVEHLHLSGFVVIMWKPPAQAPSVALGPHLPLKD